MALSKLYYTQANCVIDDNSTAKLVTASWLFAIKTLLTQLKTGTTGTSGAPPAGAAWTVVSSSDGTTAGAGDNLDGGTFTGAKWVRANAGSAHSWFVLQSPNDICAFLGTQSFYLIVDWGTTADTTYNFLLSKTAPTGGSTTARPTSVDEVGLTNHVMADVTAGAVHRTNLVTDARGNFHISISRGGSLVFQDWVWVSETVMPGLASGDLFPMVVGGDTVASGRGSGSTATITTAQAWNGANGFTTRSPMNIAPATSQGTGVIIPINASFLTGIVPNQANSGVDTIACRMFYYNASSTLMGHKGTIPDWWIGNSTRAVGSVEPAVGASEHINIGYFWVPNGGVNFTV